MDEKIREKVEEIHEGIQNLKERTNFNTLRLRERLPEIETDIDKFRADQQPVDALQDALQIFHQTAGLALEGESAYDATIWDANVQARGRMTTLEELFSDIEELV